MSEPKRSARHRAGPSRGRRILTGSRHLGRTSLGRNMLTLLTVACLSISLVVGLGSVWFYRHLNENLTVLDVESRLGSDRPEQVAPGEPVNVLVMGSDSRGGDEGVAQMRNGGARSDTTILMHLSSDRSFAYGVSLPRDAMVDRPACQTDEGEIPAADDTQFNEAFYAGGVACTVKTVESLTGVRIDHWVVVNFNGFVDMVDAIGGVDVCVPHEIDDDEYDMHLAAGTQTIKGPAALDYVRVRHGFGDGSDIGRMKRQQAFVASMAAKVVSAGTLARVDRLVGFLNASTKSLALDEGMGSITDLARLGNEFRNIGLENIQFITVPFEQYEPDPNRVQWDADAAEGVWAKMRNDQPLSRRLASDAIRADEQPTADPSAPSAAPTPRPSNPTETADAAAEAEANGLCA